MAFVFVGLDACLPQSGAVVIESLNLKAHAALPSRHTPPSPATNPPKQIVLRDGALTVYRRSRSQRYQCRFRLASGAWHRQTTGASSIERTYVGSARYMLSVTPSGLNTATVSAKIELYPTSLNPIASFLTSDNSASNRGIYSGQVAGNCPLSAPTDITISGRITALSSREAYLAPMKSPSFMGWANQLTFRLDAITYGSGSFAVTVPTFGTTTILGYTISDNRLFFVTGEPWDLPPYEIVQGSRAISFRQLDWTYLTKQ